jgi:endonuclease YncB( thermonuclease family)
MTAARVDSDMRNRSWNGQRLFPVALQAVPKDRSRVWRALTLTALVLAWIWPAHAETDPTEARLWGTVRMVQYGVHLTVVSPDLGPMQVKLLGVELPEPPRPGTAGEVGEGQPFGKQAFAYLRDLALERQVHLVTYGKDRMGRLLSVVWLGDINLNVALVKEGLAWVDSSLTITAARAALDVAERQARVGKYGLWALPNPEPPWDYRRRHNLATY